MQALSEKKTFRPQLFVSVNRCKVFGDTEYVFYIFRLLLTARHKTQAYTLTAESDQAVSENRLDLNKVPEFRSF